MIKEINLSEWKKHLLEDKITTNSLWISNLNENPIFGKFLIPKRDFLPKNDPNFHGLWIPEIPYQFMLRFTKENDYIWSQFGGSGTDYKVAKLLNRNIFINDINPYHDFIEKADSRFYKTPQKVKLILSHPPYWDIIKYSDKEEDGSNKKTLEEFLKWWVEIVENSINNIEKDGYFILACGNIYKNGEEIELGELLKNIMLTRGFRLKQHIIKDYGETKGSDARQYNLNYYRQLKFGYGNFYGDNIYVLQYKKSKNNITQIIKKFI